MLRNCADSHISSLDHLCNVKLFTVTRCTHYLDYTQYQFQVAPLHLKSCEFFLNLQFYFWMLQGDCP